MRHTFIMEFNFLKKLNFIMNYLLLYCLNKKINIMKYTIEEIMDGNRYVIDTFDDHDISTHYLFLSKIEYIIYQHTSKYHYLIDPDELNTSDLKNGYYLTYKNGIFNLVKKVNSPGLWWNHYENKIIVSWEFVQCSNKYDGFSLDKFVHQVKMICGNHTSK